MAATAPAAGGIVTATAIDDAGRALDADGCTGWVEDCGGDVLERSRPGEATLVAIADPSDSGARTDEGACGSRLSSFTPLTRVRR